MCGIVAIHNYTPDTPPLDVRVLYRIRDAMRLRGPDGEGAWVAPDGRTGLGHRRLSVIDPRSRSDQPMRLVGAGLRIVFNGEIYNHAELRAALEARGECFETTSDTEVLLRLYAREGEAMLPRLRGMFAFCIHDERNGALFCARDPLGIKPLYIADDGRAVRLASQVKALLAGGGVDTSPDPAGHVGFFLLGTVPEPHTLYRGIRAFAPGSWLYIDGDGRRREGRYFDLVARLRDAEPARGPLPREQLAGLLRESVARHMVSDVPLLLLLSAGRDSATLGALMAELGHRPESLTIAFDHPSVSDERGEAAALARHLGARHRERMVTREEFLTGQEALIGAMDQPTIDGINLYWAALAAAGAGYKVALSGLGADELFGGYPGFRQVPALVAAVSRLPGRGAVGRGLRRLSSPLCSHLGAPKYAGLLEYGGSIGDGWLLRRALYMPWELEGLLDPDLVRTGVSELELRDRLNRESAAPLGPYASMVALESGWYMRNQLLRDADWAGMAHGVEVRVPFADAALVGELAPWLVGSHPPGKGEMAGSPCRALPDPVMNRPKTGFGVPVRAWGATQSGARGVRGEREWARRVYAATWGTAP